MTHVAFQNNAYQLRVYSRFFTSQFSEDTGSAPIDLNTASGNDNQRLTRTVKLSDELAAVFWFRLTKNTTGDLKHKSNLKLFSCGIIDF